MLRSRNLAVPIQASDVRQAVDTAVEILSTGGRKDFEPLAWLLKAAFHRKLAVATSSEWDWREAIQAVDHALAIAERGLMKLHIADCKIEFCRILTAQPRLLSTLKTKDFVWDLFPETKRCISSLNYGRRSVEIKSLADTFEAKPLSL
jgi:hypothetical protein